MTNADDQKITHYKLVQHSYAAQSTTGLAGAPATARVTLG